jgi:Carboxypeptidase regulatory-like domain
MPTHSEPGDEMQIKGRARLICPQGSSISPLKDVAVTENLIIPSTEVNESPREKRDISTNWNSLLTALTATVLFMFSALAFGQYTSNVQGTVFDPSKLVIPGATVVLKNTDTGLMSTIKTNESGLYHFSNVAPGNYTVTVDATGFQEARVSTTLTAASTAGLDVTLQLAGASSSVTVNEISGTLNPDETRLQTTIAADTISNLPLQNNGVYSMVTAAPGVSGFNDSRYADNFTNEHVIQANANGTYFGGNSYILDGINVDSTVINGEVNISPNPDSLQEVTMQTNTFSAQYGNSSSVVMEMASKSGTNTFHGSASYLFTNQSLTATTEFIQQYSPFKRNDISGSIGGPVIKNRTFLFGSFELKRSSQQGLSSGNGDTGSAGLVNYNDPAFTAWALANHPNTHGTYILNEYMPTHVAFRSVAEWADPTFSTFCFAPTAGCSTPFVDSGVPTATPYDNGLQYNVRGDQFFRDGKDKVFVNFYHTRHEFIADDIRPAFDAPAYNLNWYSNLTYSHVFTPNLMNNARMGAFAPSGMQSSNNLNGIQGGPLSKMPFLSTNAEGISFGNNAWGPAVFVNHTYDFNDLVTYVHARHAIKIGFEAFHGDESADFSGPRERPAYSFANLPAFVEDQVFSESGVTFSPLTGQFTPSKFGDQLTKEGVFIQDEWKVKPNLLLSLGLRWDDFGNASPATYPKQYPEMANVYPGTGTLDQMFANATVKGSHYAFEHRMVNNWSPRVGFAWSPFAKRDFSIRGGIGLYRTEITLGQTLDPLSLNPPNSITPTFGVQQQTPAVYSYGTNTVAPFGFTYPTVPAAGLDNHGGIVGLAINVNGIDPNLSVPKTLLYQLAMEKQLKANLIVGINYSGSNGYGLISGNQDYNRFAGDLVSHDGKLTRLNPSFGSIGFVGNKNNSDYNAMILTVRQTVRAGFDWQASYTYSHALDDGTCSTEFDYNSNLDCSPDQHHMLHGTSSFDTKGRFSLSGVYTIPTPRIEHMSQVLGGWAISSIAIAQSGQPFTAINGASYCIPPANTVWGPDNPYPNNCGDYNADGYNHDYPNLGSAKPGGFSRKEFLAGVFPAGSFTTPTIGEVGDEGRNMFRGPGFVNIDATLMKNFSFPWFHDQRSKFQLRGNFYNVINRVNLTGVDNSVTSGTFGRALNTLQPRLIQLTGRFEF